MKRSNHFKNLADTFIALKYDIRKQSYSPTGKAPVDWVALRPILGKVPDVLIAECYGVSRERVRQLRRKFNIKLQCKQKQPVKIPISELKEFSLAQLAAKYGIRASEVSAQRIEHGIPNRSVTIKAKLEKLFKQGAHLRMTDSEIAYKLGCGLSTVQKSRQVMGCYKRKHLQTYTEHLK